MLFKKKTVCMMVTDDPTYVTGLRETVPDRTLEVMR